MTSVPPTQPASPGHTPGTTLSGPNTQLGSDAFLKLMMVQLTHQDPLSPSDPTQYLSELAQFTQVEQTTNTAQSTAKTASAQSTAAAVALIGKSVTYTDAKTGATGTGTVASVQISAAGPTLTVGTATGIAPAAVTEVR